MRASGTYSSIDTLSDRSRIVLVDIHAKVPLSVPIMGALVVLAENGGEVFDMLTANT